MDFSYTKEQEILKDVLREFCDKEITPEAAEYDRRREFDYTIKRGIGLTPVAT